MKYLFFQDKVNKRWALPPLTGRWSRKNLVAGLRDPQGGYRLAIADDGSGIGPGGVILHEPGYFTPVGPPPPIPSKFVDNGQAEGFTGKVLAFVDPDGIVRGIEGYRGVMQGTTLIATYYGLGSAYFVGEDGCVFCDGGLMFPAGYFTRIDEEPPPGEPPRSPPRLRDAVLDLLVTENPKKLDAPTRDAYAEYVKPLLIACFDHQKEDSATGPVYLVPFGSAPIDHPAMARIGTRMREIVRAVDKFLPPQWTRDFQEITNYTLEISRFAGSGDLLEGGYVVFRQPDGTHYLEHTHGPRRGDDVDPVPWDTYDVHRVDIPDDVYEELDWVGETDEDRLAAGRDKDPCVRAEEIALVGDDEGWENLDCYPLRLSGKELRLRWEREDWDEMTAEDGRGYQSSLEPPGLSNLSAVLYELLTHAERKKEDFDEALARARKLRRITNDADENDAEQDVSYAARRIAEALTQKDPHLSLPPCYLLVRAEFQEMERIVYDEAKGVWVVKPYS